jgi:hypothetical protein
MNADGKRRTGEKNPFHADSSKSNGPFESIDGEIKSIK